MLGEVIHGYRIERALSEDKGGFGDVFFASHVESGAEAVVKVLKPEMSAMHDIVARFFNEARAAASVHHPGIVQIHNMGYHRDRAYLLMERLRGEDLETRMQRGPLPLERVLVFLRQTAGAIGAAHDRGIVHRDLKPANLFIVPDPDVVGGERIKVLDFGIAKLTAETGAGKTQGVFGTPSYMSPEQCASTGAVDGRADLYSLGCIFYELMCGRPPFGHGGLELIAAHLRDVPPPPRTFAPWLPPAIEQVILGLLEKQPMQRTPTCAALVAQLDAASATLGPAGASGSTPLPYAGGYPSGVPSSTTLGSAAGAMTQPPRRGLGLWLGIGAVLVIGGVVTVMAMGGKHAPVGSPPVAVHDAGVGDAAAADAATKIAMAADAMVPADAPVAIDAAVPVDAAVERKVAPDPQQVRLAEQANQKGKEAMFESRYDDARKLFQEAAARVSNPLYFFNLCVAQANLGRLEEAMVAAKAALESNPSAQLREKTHKIVAYIRKMAAEQHVTLHNDLPEVPNDSPKVSAKVESASTRIEALSSDGKAAMLAGEHAKALQLYQQAYEIEPTATMLFNIGLAQAQLGQCAEAKHTLQRVWSTWPKDPVVANTRKAYDKLGDCR